MNDCIGLVDLKLLRSHVYRYIMRYKLSWFAHQVGLTQSGVVLHLLGDRRIHMRQLKRYCQVLDTNEKVYFFGSTDNVTANVEEAHRGFIEKLRPSSKQPTALVIRARE